MLSLQMLMVQSSCKCQERLSNNLAAASWGIQYPPTNLLPTLMKTADQLAICRGLQIPSAYELPFTNAQKVLKTSWDSP
jgi:hypothetical protein